jgi:SPW repeat-containing protein
VIILTMSGGGGHIVKALSWTNFALGTWLIVAPFVLLYRGIQAALWDDLTVGLIIAAYSLWQALEIEQLIVGNWIVGALGLWTLVSPFVLHFSSTTIAMRNNVIVGAAVTIVTIWLAANPWRHQDHRAH